MTYLSFYVLVYALCAGQTSAPNPVCAAMIIGQFRSSKACEIEKQATIKTSKEKPKMYCIESSVTMME